MKLTQRLLPLFWKLRRVQVYFSLRLRLWWSYFRARLHNRVTEFTTRPFTRQSLVMLGVSALLLGGVVKWSADTFLAVGYQDQAISRRESVDLNTLTSQGDGLAAQVRTQNCQ